MVVSLCERFVSLSAVFGLRWGSARNRLVDQFQFLARPAPDPGKFDKMGRKKLRKSTAKVLKSLVGANLCGALPMQRQEWRSPASWAFARAALHQRQSRVARRRIAEFGRSFMGGESGRTTVESWRFLKGRQSARHSGELRRRPPAAPADSGSERPDLFHNILTKQGKGDCGTFGAKSSDNYATSSGKRCVKLGL
jgi:hypothetical protein